MSAASIVLLIVGVLAANALIWVAVLRWVRRASAVAAERMKQVLGDSAVYGPVAGNYRGATAEFGKLKGNGLLALTADRIVFHKLIGDPIEIPRARVKAIREEKWFLGSRVGGQVHLILVLDNGTEVGLFVGDRDALRRALA